MATKCLTLSTIPRIEGVLSLFNHTVQFAKSQCIKSSFLISRSTNSTFNLFDLYS